jgi:antirestriction protein ArdC
MLNGLFAKIQYPVGVDYLADAMTGVRFSTASFERWGDKNHLMGKDGKTIRLRWLSAKGINIDTFAADFMRQYDNMFFDESEVIEYVVAIIIQYPSGTNAYFKTRIAEIEAENDSLNTRAAKAQKDELDENELANELFESKIKSSTRTKVKRKLVSKQRFTKEYLLLKRLVSFNNKRVDVTQLNKFSIDAHAALKGKTNHGSLLKKAVSRVDFLLFKLDGNGVKTVKKLEVSKDLLEAATKIVTQPKVRSVELGATTNNQISKWNKHPDGGQYASYKLGTITRFKTKSGYDYKYTTDSTYNAKSLQDAIKQIDAYTKHKTGLGVVKERGVKIIHKSKFAAGDIFENDEEQIEVKKVYPKGHKYASKESNFYLVDSPHSGEDVWSESTLTQIVYYGKYKPLNVKKKASLGELLFGVDLYTKAEAAELGLLDGSLAGTGKPRNPYDVVNRIIINQLDKGVVPWEMPWTMDKGKSVAPQNYGSKRDYRGINFWNLICEMDMRNHEVPYFLTSKQVADKGGKIAKGAKPYYVTYYGKFNVTETEIDKETGDTETLEKAIRFLKLYAVYNIEDTDLQFDKPDNKPAKEVERISSAEEILEGMPKKPKIKFGGNQAFYSPSQDLVQMPKPENFKQIDRYYSTFFHELVHSTKDDKRCGTDHFRKNSKAFGDKQYSWEELVAELGASYLCSEAGILHKTVGQSAAYIKGWAKSLQQYIKEDKTYFFKAANYAQKAADFILNKNNAISGVDLNLDFGPVYNQFADSPKRAIKHLLKVKTGICSNVFYREDIGYIDLPYGSNNSKNQGFGLIHILGKHGDEIRQLGFDVSDFLTICINQGHYKTSKLKNRIKLESSMFRIIIDFDKKQKAFVLSAFDLRKKALSGINGTIDGIDFTKRPLYVSTEANITKNKQRNNTINGVDEIIKIAKEVYPEADVREIKPMHPFTNMDKLQSGGTYQLKGELGKFLGNLGEVDCSITIRGDQGAGKSQLMWQLVDAFATIGKRVAVESPEMSGNSPTISKYRDQFISPENQSKILFTDQKLTVQQLKDFADMYDVLFVDSFNQLKEYQQYQFEWLSKQLPNKCIIGLFQSTTGGEMRGGNKPEFDAYVNIEVNKVDDSFVNNYAVCTKNRFGGTGLKYNISKRKIVK